MDIVPDIRLPNDVRLHWLEAGTPSGPPIVWIHGGSVEDASMMLADLKPFFGHVRALFPDIRGHGLSSRFERVEDYTYQRKMEDLLLWLQAIGVREAVWGGASMGAALSLWTAIHAPAVVRAVISISGPAHAPVESDKQWWAGHRHLVAAGRFNAYFDENIRLRMGEDALARLKARPERYEAVTAQLARHSIPSLLAVLDETYSRPDWLADCARIKCPTLIISGSEDHYPTVAMSRSVTETISGAALHVVEGGPHFPNRSHRSEVQRVIGAFLAKLGVLP
jgi:pimeloyl-ACP methyl ester carboxylesterase